MKIHKIRARRWISLCGVNININNRAVMLDSAVTCKKCLRIMEREKGK